MRSIRTLHLGARQRVQRAQRLVEQQQPGMVQQRARQRHALTLAAGQQGGQIPGALGQTDFA